MSTIVYKLYIGKNVKRFVLRFFYWRGVWEREVEVGSMCRPHDHNVTIISSLADFWLILFFFLFIFLMVGMFHSIFIIKSATFMHITIDSFINYLLLSFF